VIPECAEQRTVCGSTRENLCPVLSVVDGAAPETAYRPAASEAPHTLPATNHVRFSYSAKLALLCDIARDRRLARSSVAVASVLIDHANAVSMACYPSISTIVRESRVPKTTVLRALRQLEECGWIKARKKNGARTNYDLQTSAKTGTGSAPGTGASLNLRRGSSGSVSGTEAAPRAGHEQGKKKEEIESNRSGKRKSFLQWWNATNDDERAIPKDDPVFQFADEAGIPSEFLEFAWSAFCQRYADDTKTKTDDWCGLFRRAIRENWLRIWYADQVSGEYRLTTVGIQLQRQEEATY
jgi:hypothetical protein